MSKAKSRIHRDPAVGRRNTVIVFLSTILVSTVTALGGAGVQQPEVNSQAYAYTNPAPSPSPSPIATVSAQVKPSERKQIMDYLYEKFGDRAIEAITVIRGCENGAFDPKKVSGLNIQQSGRRSYDIGLMQINTDELDTVEQDKLKDWHYNIDRGYAKYHASGDKFTQWSCAHVIGEKNYLGK